MDVKEIKYGLDLNPEWVVFGELDSMIVEVEAFQYSIGFYTKKYISRSKGLPCLDHPTRQPKINDRLHDIGVSYNTVRCSLEDIERQKVNGKWEILANLGSLLLRHGFVNDGHDALQESLEMNPENVAAKYNLSVLFLRTGRKETAYELVKNLKESMRPEYEKLEVGKRINLLWMQNEFERGNFNETTALLENIFRNDEKNESVFVRLLASMIWQKREEEAIKLLSEKFQSTGNIQININGIVCLVLLKRFENALKMVNALLENEKMHPEYRFLCEQIKNICEKK